MYCCRWNYTYLLFVSFLFCFLPATIAETKCEKCQITDTDQALLVHDYGPDGIAGPFNVTLTNTLKPGSVISVVVKSETRGSVNLIADDIYVVHVDTRIHANQLVVATSKHLNLEWDPNMLVLPNPVGKNAKTTVTLMYETDGYRIFINERKVAYYVHRSNKMPHVLNLQHNYVYKILYLTTVAEKVKKNIEIEVV